MTPVISPPSRVFQCATLLFVLSGVRCSFSQSVHGPVASENQSLDLSLTLPDAPSYSSSQQSTPSQTTGQPGTAPASPTADQSQAGSQPPPNETPEQKKERERLEGEEQVRRQEHQRNLGVIPSFNTVIAGKVPPLTAGEKFDLVYHTLKDPYTFALAAIVSGFGELSPPAQGYGWGPGGYFYRYGTAYADNVDGAIWGNAILPVLLRQDPRYYRKGEGSASSRIIHAALSTVICKGDNGKTQFNISNVAGNLIAGGLSNIYYPHEQRGASLIYSNGLTVTLEGAAGAQLLEFGPDLGNYIHKRREHHRQVLAAQKAAQTNQPASAPAPPKTPPPPTVP